MAANRKFSDDDLIQAHDEYDGNKTKMAEALGVSRLTIRQRLDKLPVGMLVKREQWNDVSKLGAMRDLQRRLLVSITDADIKKASAQARITTLAILEDKIRTMEGKAIEHVEHKMLHQLDPKYLDALRELDEKLTKAKLEQAYNDRDDIIDVQPISLPESTGTDSGGDSPQESEIGEE